MISIVDRGKWWRRVCTHGSALQLKPVGVAKLEQVVLHYNLKCIANQVDLSFRVAGTLVVLAEVVSNSTDSTLITMVIIKCRSSRLSHGLKRVTTTRALGKLS